MLVPALGRRGQRYVSEFPSAVESLKPRSLGEMQVLQSDHGQREIGTYRTVQRPCAPYLMLLFKLR